MSELPSNRVRSIVVKDPKAIEWFRIIFGLRPSSDPDIEGEEGWLVVDDVSYWAHLVDGELWITEL